MFTASAPGTVIESSGGEGGDASTDGCTFKVLQPAEGTDATNPCCPAGGTSKAFPVTILNLCTEMREFNLEFPEGKCAVTESLLLAGNENGTMLLEDCKCPVRQGEQTSSFK